jgi:hypothetical protein
MGLVAVLEKADDIKVYAEHPAHIECVAVFPPFFILIPKSSFQFLAATCLTHPLPPQSSRYQSSDL